MLASIISLVLINSQDHRRASEIRSNQFNSESVRAHAAEEPRVSSNRLSMRKDGRTLSGVFIQLAHLFQLEGESLDRRVFDSSSRHKQLQLTIPENRQHVVAEIKTSFADELPRSPRHYSETVVRNESAAEESICCTRGPI